ncbi:MAG: hypothetical protein A3D65_01025 [Candidatus Lloydbacteria bacterium RIFCSPHIGHO2_02_FULL_50_13]|uniref:Uncharacterized protein n=1 Tax=Candidatus Lloydbacteria bacterium RIFCSPHIGHO2_02_FULL_50_13 TaxID=1798661 RepID=A0A1G2D3Y5_9BACT|nr:MAG: hypothetical protein A3D65_01025 [Candidatus Lloydbacteria bacterium RIFCSPHIGHO2_02_FULL_50_13]
MFFETQEENARLKEFYDKALEEVGLQHRYITRSDWKFVVGHEVTKKIERRQSFLGFSWTTKNEVVVGHFVVEPVRLPFKLPLAPNKQRNKLHVVVVEKDALQAVRTFCEKFEKHFDIPAFYEVR